MTIHDENPFADAPDPVRRFRGRLGGAVTLWTAGTGAERAGLTVSSLMVANGDPASVLALLDPDSDFRDRFEETGLAVVQLLGPEDIALAEAFAGTIPAPGGPFRLGSWEQADHGPVLLDRSRALVRFSSALEVGWSVLVTATVEDISVVDLPDGLEHRRGRYRRSVDPDR
jgi:flavin reductase (DIM6/NTAB) family NADH-FMN oxidoreductase RutF